MANVNPPQQAVTEQNQQQMQEQMQQMQQQMQQMQQQMQQMQQQIQQLRTTGHQASEYNSIARLDNACIRRNSDSITALRDYTTNASIPGFPVTPAQLWNMQGPVLDQVLTALGLPTDSG
ncbi:uncharacterized protein BDZ99DRAFT_527578 [Mytilinidion resinicola]|uniref:Uncharacterized protein n=1 Tax=Mytilinidion resinicola TaxID=574789 RepID=A0A6A6Y0N4_9PEZI|nr:uncharacterized protein BDZ99DRAFT_527578 [Mytilinidion resinicola]KAF2802209.1 hypothetical protein BDZ99DRAFT_527578 [Mytilinidion resinicola]